MCGVTGRRSRVRRSTNPGFVYRFIATGSIEEKILQRQSHKQSLSSCVVDDALDAERHFSGEDLRALFQFKDNTICDTHDTYKCKRCRDGKQMAPSSAMLYGDTSTYVLNLTPGGTTTRTAISASYTTIYYVQRSCTATFRTSFNTVAISLFHRARSHAPRRASLGSPSAGEMSAAELPIEAFLKTQPRSVLNRLYEKPASCLAVFRYAP